jgi:hypothetical protein
MREEINPDQNHSRNSQNPREKVLAHDSPYQEYRLRSAVQILLGGSIDR